MYTFPWKQNQTENRRGLKLPKGKYIHKLDNQTLKPVKTDFIILDVSILNTGNFSAK